MTQDMDATTENGGSDRRPRPNRDDRLHDQRLQREGRRMPILSTTRRRTMPPGTVMGFPVIGGTAANNADATSKRIKAGDISASSASPDESSERHPCPAQASKIHAQGAYEKSIGINPFSNKIAAMNKDNRISPELQTKIDALEDEKLRKDITFLLGGPGNRTATNEEIFNNRVASYEKAKAERALREARLYKWREDEVIAFIDYFREQQPQEHADYLHQERNDRQIDADLAWCMRRLGEQWLPGLNWEDYDELFDMVRDYTDAHLI
ncbi:MAG: hypothetical protein ABL934_07945 [Lysobacteraceae bacterium]